MTESQYEDHLEEWRRQKIDDEEYLRELYRDDESDWYDDDEKDLEDDEFDND